MVTSSTLITAMISFDSLFFGNSFVATSEWCIGFIHPDNVKLSKADQQNRQLSAVFDIWHYIFLDRFAELERVKPSLPGTRWFNLRLGSIDWVQPWGSATPLAMATATVLRWLPVTFILNFLFWLSALYVLFRGQSSIPWLAAVWQNKLQVQAHGAQVWFLPHHTFMRTLQATMETP